jgi:hypothetical protein
MSNFFDRVVMNDGPYADERELLLAAWADGHDEAMCRAMLAEFAAARDAEWAAEQASEMAAENAWLTAAENAGWEESERERAYDQARGVFA